MSVIARTLRRLAPSTLAMFALAIAACAAAEDPSDDDDGGPTLPRAGTTGVGGQSNGTSGTGTTAGTTGTAGKPAATGGTPTGTGGQTSTGGTPSTGTAGTTGTAGSTGTAGATGTAGSAGSCPPYAGALAADSTIFTAGFGRSTTGMWSGYGYTYVYGTATVTPGKGNSCFAGMKFCASGSVPAADTAGAGLGWNIAQMLGATTMSKAPIATAVKLTFKGVTEGMRVQLSASATVSYCYTLTAAEALAGTVTIPFASFKTACWGTTGMAYDGVVPIEAIQVAVPGSTAGLAAKMFDFCVLDIEPG